MTTPLNDVTQTEMPWQQRKRLTGIQNARNTAQDTITPDISSLDQSVPNNTLNTISQTSTNSTAGAVASRNAILAREDTAKAAAFQKSQQDAMAAQTKASTDYMTRMNQTYASQQNDITNQFNQYKAKAAAAQGMYKAYTG